jgi:hypothetical protein
MRQAAPLLLALSCIFVASCGAKKDLTSTNSAVAKFHAQLDAGNFDQIYADSDDAMKQAITKGKFTDLLSAVHRKLGNVKSAIRKTFFINWDTSGETIRVTYETQFESDNTEEQFVFTVSGKEAKLVGYHINSDVLITK